MNDTARAALRARQGGGARYDHETAPHDDLLQARRAVSAFARSLQQLDDDTLRTHADPVLHVSYMARALAEAIETLRTGKPAETEAYAARRLTGRSLPAHAIRSLFRHAMQHMNVEWRDLDAAGWASTLDLDGKRLPVRDTPGFMAQHLRDGRTSLGEPSDTTRQ